ncbi:hypothetical protein JCM8097_001998 [Rhodosporidiobolus ruineniae]
MARKLLTALALALLCAVALAADDSSDSSSSSGERTTGIDGYIPKKALSFIGIITYGGVALVQWFLLFRNGFRAYMLPVVLGMTFMAGGFAIRVYYANNWDSLGVYIGMTMLILCSPCLFLAQDYMLLHRLADAMGPNVAQRALFIRSSLITKLFVTSDIVTFLLQAGGGGMSAASSSMAKYGPKVALVGLFIQLICFLLFCTLFLVFVYRVRNNYPHLRHPASPFSIRKFGGPLSAKLTSDWRPLAVVLGLTMIGILVRSVYRIIEYAQGRDGALMTHEGYFYILDALPLLLSMALFCIIWPPRVLDGVERKGASAPPEEIGFAVPPTLDRHSPWTRVDEEAEQVGGKWQGGRY